MSVVAFKKHGILPSVVLQQTSQSTRQAALEGILAIQPMW